MNRISLLLFGLFACTTSSEHESDAGVAVDKQPARDAAVPRDGAFDAGTLRDAAPVLDAARAAQRDASTTLVDAALRDASVLDWPADAATRDAAEPNSQFAVGTQRIDLTVGEGRTLPVQLWYPASESARAEANAGHSIELFEPEGPRRDVLTGLLQATREGCTNRTMHAALNAAPAASTTPWPLIVYSHHYSGTRFSMFTIAEALAQQGFLVAAPDHVRGSLFDRTDAVGDSLRQINAQFLQTRADDLRGVLDVVLDPAAQAMPEALRGRADATRVGAAGHSWGGVTVGILAAADTRVKATAYFAISPTAEPLALFGAPAIARFRTPGLYLVAQEDGVMASFGGNQAIVNNFEQQPPAAWLVDVRDVGHFSFADDCELAPEFGGCCGTGTRVANMSEPFAYIDTAQARDIAQRYAVAFFAHQLQAASAAPLSQATPAELVMVRERAARP